MEQSEWDEVEEKKVVHEAQEPSTYELAEQELKARENKFIRQYE